MQSSLIKSAIFIEPSENEQSHLDIDSLKNQFLTIGKNRKKILIISDHSINENESLQHKLLVNMLKAVQLEIDDVILIQLNKNIHFKYLLKCYDVEVCLFFGLIPKNLNLNIIGQYYKIIPFHNRKLVFAENLAVINKEKASKEAIWKNLKRLFQ